MKEANSALDHYIADSMASEERRLHGEARRNRILASAMIELSEFGFRNASMARIAKRAKVSTASLYLDFATRDDMLERAITKAVPLISADLVAAATEERPRERLVKLLELHCRVFQHPHANWLYRAHVSGELSNNLKMSDTGQGARILIETYWRSELKTLEAKGVLKISNLDAAINHLLGSVQRRSLLSMLLFGPDDDGAPDVATAARSAVDWLFAVYGTPEAKQAAL